MTHLKYFLQCCIYDSLANPILLTLLILLYVYIIENHKEQKNAEGGQVFESRAIDISEKRRKIGGSTWRSSSPSCAEEASQSYSRGPHYGPIIENAASLSLSSPKYYHLRCASTVQQVRILIRYNRISWCKFFSSSCLRISLILDAADLFVTFCFNHKLHNFVYLSSTFWCTSLLYYDISSGLSGEFFFQ